MYRAPLKELQFVLHDLIGDDALRGCRELGDYSADLADSVLAEAGRFAESVLDPVYRSGDEDGARWTAEGVVTPPGFKDAYARFMEGGWPSLQHHPDHGGQGMPRLLASAVEEIWTSANCAFKLCPMLTHTAVEALEQVGTPEQQATYLPKLVSGEWTGTMNLTEPQAGSDLAQVRTRAVPEGNRFRLFGQKIFITYGEHDFTPNIVHLVLARIEGAAAGVKGISLFLVPKFLPKPDGSPGERNDVHCLSIEHKLGIHASPTCVMAYGQKDGAIGYLVGEANAGLKHMFIMMNAARLAVGLEGYALSERAFQQAAQWARTRVQGKPPVAAPDGPAPIIHHPDVKRMLLTMKSHTEAMRALALYAAYLLDLGERHPDQATAEAAATRGALLIPIVKGWSTDSGVELTSLGIQVHGGMGYVEETGAAQPYRDVRISSIYEGTTGIQANDLLNRKLSRDQGAALNALLAEATQELRAISADDGDVDAARTAALEAIATTHRAAASVLKSMMSAPADAYAVSIPFLKLCGLTLGGWLLAKSAAIAASKLAGGAADRQFLEGKVASARFYADHVLPQTLALARVVEAGARSVVDTEADLI
ncbi:MAG TPA: acyl-CoA dehydrogenase [Steroidobacteraceae bacterium]|nr:acyl-CoA dehydrogenase [Steroidobacteraceae bacterium]